MSARNPHDVKRYRARLASGSAATCDGRCRLQWPTAYRAGGKNRGETG